MAKFVGSDLSPGGLEPVGARPYVSKVTTNTYETDTWKFYENLFVHFHCQQFFAVLSVHCISFLVYLMIEKYEVVRYVSFTSYVLGW